MSAILIVEDEPAIADFVDGGLRAHGHGTAVTDDAPGALALFAVGTGLRSLLRARPAPRTDPSVHC
jgi:DNA-binding response OmpR family regulator